MVAFFSQSVYSIVCSVNGWVEGGKEVLRVVYGGWLYCVIRWDIIFLNNIHSREYMCGFLFNWGGVYSVVIKLGNVVAYHTTCIGIAYP